MPAQVALTRNVIPAPIARPRAVRQRCFATTIAEDGQDVDDLHDPDAEEEREAVARVAARERGDEHREQRGGDVQREHEADAFGDGALVGSCFVVHRMPAATSGARRVLSSSSR